MQKLSEQTKERIKELIKDAEIKKLVSLLKKLKLFPVERGILNEQENKERFLIANKMRYTSDDHDKKCKDFEKALSTILYTTLNA